MERGSGSGEGECALEEGAALGRGVALGREWLWEGRVCSRGRVRLLGRDSGCCCVYWLGSASRRDRLQPVSSRPIACGPGGRTRLDGKRPARSRVVAGLGVAELREEPVRWCWIAYLWLSNLVKSDETAALAAMAATSLIALAILEPVQQPRAPHPHPPPPPRPPLTRPPRGIAPVSSHPIPGGPQGRVGSGGKRPAEGDPAAAAKPRPINTAHSTSTTWANLRSVTA